MLSILQSMLSNMGIMWADIILLEQNITFLLQEWQKYGLNNVLMYTVLFPIQIPQVNKSSNLSHNHDVKGWACVS